MEYRGKTAELNVSEEVVALVSMAQGVTYSNHSSVVGSAKLTSASQTNGLARRAEYGVARVRVTSSIVNLLNTKLPLVLSSPEILEEIKTLLWVAHDLQDNSTIPNAVKQGLVREVIKKGCLCLEKSSNVNEQEGIRESIKGLIFGDAQLSMIMGASPSTTRTLFNHFHPEPTYSLRYLTLTDISSKEQSQRRQVHGAFFKGLKDHELQFLRFATFDQSPPALKLRIWISRLTSDFDYFDSQTKVVLPRFEKDSPGPFAAILQILVVVMRSWLMLAWGAVRECERVGLRQLEVAGRYQLFRFLTLFIQIASPFVKLLRVTVTYPYFYLADICASLVKIPSFELEKWMRGSEQQRQPFLDLLEFMSFHSADAGRLLMQLSTVEVESLPAASIVSRALQAVSNAQAPKRSSTPLIVFYPENDDELPTREAKIASFMVELVLQGAQGLG